MLKSAVPGAMAFALLVIVPAVAEAGSPPPARVACAADSKALCTSAPRGGGGVRQCLNENHAKLSTECRAALKASESSGN